LFLQVVLASTDFDVFMQLMTDVAKEEQTNKPSSKHDSDGDDDETHNVSSSYSSSKHGDDDDGDFI
jgi:hypothetical protein